MPATPVILLTIFRFFIPITSPNIPNIPGKIMSKRNDSSVLDKTGTLNKNNNPSKTPINPEINETNAFLLLVFIVLIFI